MASPPVEEELSVEKTLVIVFDDEAKVHGASHAFQGLEDHGDVTLDDLAIIIKHPDGSACTTKIGRFRGLARMVIGCVVGGFFGLPGGPVGIAVGLIGGGIIGGVGRKEHSFDKEFANDIRNALTPGKAAVIAEVTEVSEPPVDNRMAELGGVVFRWTTDRIKIGDSKRRSADLDELGVKIDDAIASRKAKVQARKHERERWIHLLEQEAAEGRRKRREPHTAELPAAAAKPAAQYGA
jgi:uncharacterized membrane protein